MKQTMTGRYKRNDIFWFTFFHEAGHILLHGKKDVFLEQRDNTNLDSNNEREADEFAIKWTLSKEEEATIIEALPLDETTLTSFATKYNTHPAIIVGRLQHDKLIEQNRFNQFKEPVSFEQ
ncbi:MAG: ImmA/IrrE family metallo-endopeptidase [Bacteroidales bacterium]|nr:ImmA/IrrE family metallo-endopeptidase [Bacteroidales bacterium]